MKEKVFDKKSWYNHKRDVVSLSWMEEGFSSYEIGQTLTQESMWCELLSSAERVKVSCM